jgi:hypothetical protein
LNELQAGTKLCSMRPNEGNVAQALGKCRGSQCMAWVRSFDDPTTGYCAHVLSALAGVAEK